MRHYRSYTYTNSTASAQCVTVSVTQDCGNNAIQSVAYLGSFNPASLCTNYLGDGSASGHNFSYAFTLAAGQTAVVTVLEVSPNLGCATYTLSISPCSTTPANTPTPTMTRTVTQTRTNTPTFTATRTRTSTATLTPGLTTTSTSTPTSVAVITGHITWQGIPQPNSRNSGITATLSLCVGGVAQNYNVATDANGVFTVTTALPDGNYNWWVKGQINLANAGTLTVTGGASSFEVGTLRAGDCDNSNVVNTTDFSITKSTFGKSVGQPGYDARGDANRDTVVNTTDFNLLKGNFGQSGAVLTCP